MNKTIGSVLLVVAMTTGAGMLALPVACSFAGFWTSVLLLAAMWALMFATAYLFAEITLEQEGETNLISMAGRYTGVAGKVLTWVSTLLLLYSLLVAYISGSAHFVTGALGSFGMTIPLWLGALPMLLLFALFVYLGTGHVDRLNRILIGVKAAAFFLLLFLLPSHLEPRLLSQFDPKAIWVAIPVVFTTFGFHTIIPTLATYLGRNRKKLLSSLFWGSFIPFVLYVVWNLMTLGIIPLTGEASMASAWKGGLPATVPLADLLQTPAIHLFSSLFTCFAIFTSFLAVAMGLSDFLRDGLQLHRSVWGREIACLLTFFPPLFFALTVPRAFLLALEYAGIFVAILLCLLPAWISWKLPKFKERKGLLALIAFLSLVAITMSLLNQAGFFAPFIAPYVQT
jgi:tyrosine-specific transport protein